MNWSFNHSVWLALKGLTWWELSLNIIKANVTYWKLHIKNYFKKSTYFYHLLTIEIQLRKWLQGLIKTSHVKMLAIWEKTNKAQIKCCKKCRLPIIKKQQKVIANNADSSEFITNNIDTFGQLLPKTEFFRSHIKQYWHFQKKK